MLWGCQRAVCSVVAQGKLRAENPHQMPQEAFPCRGRTEEARGELSTPSEVLT